MANWYYMVDGEEKGPVSSSDLKKLAKEGELGPGDQLQKEGDEEWTTAKNIKGLFTSKEDADSNHISVEASSSDTKKQSATDKDSESDDMAGFGSKAKSAMKQVAQLSVKKASLKKLEYFTLANAELAIGTKAMDLSVGKVEFPEVYQQIADIEQKVKDNRVPEETGEHETVIDRTKRLGRATKKKVQIEVLLSKRKKVITALGRSISRQTEVDASGDLSVEIEKANSVAAQIAPLKEEITVLEKHVPSLPVNKKLLTGLASVAALILVAWLFGVFSPGDPSEAARAQLDDTFAQSEVARAQLDETLEQIARETSEEQERIKQELLNLDRKQTLNQAEAQQRSELLKAKKALDLKKKQIEKDRRSRQLAEERKQDKEQRQKKTALQQEQAAIDRKKLAKRLLGSVPLDPNKSVILSKNLKEMNVTIELRGRNYTEIKRLQKDEDWLNLINLLRKTQYDELPPASVIERAYSDMVNYEFSMLVKTNQRLIGSDNTQGLHLIYFPIRIRSYYSSIASSVSRWKLHPDGIGYLHSWEPSNGQAVAVFANGEEVQNRIRAMNSRFSEKLSGWKTKLDLGELDEATLQDNVTIEVKRAYAGAVSWAKGL
jgi:hypothetical protein